MICSRPGRRNPSGTFLSDSWAWTADGLRSVDLRKHISNVRLTILANKALVTVRTIIRFTICSNGPSMSASEALRFRDGFDAISGSAALKG